jgi:hypothetical protein
VFAPEVGITFDVLGEIPTRTGIAVIIDGDIVEDFSLSGLGVKLSIISLKYPQILGLRVSLL